MASSRLISMSGPVRRTGEVRVPGGQQRDDHNVSRTHLANERTFLAWVRTAISVVALGLAAAAFLDGHGQRSWLHAVMAVTMVLAGAIMLPVGYLRFRAASVAIEEQRTVAPHVRSIALATAGVTAASILGVVFLTLR